MRYDNYDYATPGPSTLAAGTLAFSTVQQQVLPRKVRDREPLDYADLPAGVSPELHPYMLKVRGHHLAPQLRSGDQILISPKIELQRGMIVAIFPRGANAALKRLVVAPPAKPWVSGLDDALGCILIVSQDNPPRVYHLPAAGIEDVHGAIGVIRNGVYSRWS